MVTDDVRLPRLSPVSLTLEQAWGKFDRAVRGSQWHKNAWEALRRQKNMKAKKEHQVRLQTSMYIAAGSLATGLIIFFVWDLNLWILVTLEALTFFSCVWTFIISERRLSAALSDESETTIGMPMAATAVNWRARATPAAIGGRTKEEEAIIEDEIAHFLASVVQLQRILAESIKIWEKYVTDVGTENVPNHETLRTHLASEINDLNNLLKDAERLAGYTPPSGPIRIMPGVVIENPVSRQALFHQWSCKQRLGALALRIE